jgi:hypothetical protein
MPNARQASLALAAAALLVGGAVYAAGSDMSPNANADAATQDSSQAQTQAPATQDQPPMNSPDTGAQAQTGVAANTSAQVQVIASQPVPDTPENRAKYGQPLSRAGRHTKPAGN